MELLPHIADERLRDLYLYWNRLRGDRFAPARAEIDPADIPRLLPHLLLSELVEDGRRLRYRLVGTEVERNFGRSMTGLHVDEVMRGSYLEFILGLYRGILEQRVPSYSENSFRDAGAWKSPRHPPLRTARVMLPLSSDGSTIDMVLSGQVFFWSAVPTRRLDQMQDYFSITEGEAKIIDTGAAAS
jgi:hypothetical protein